MNAGAGDFAQRVVRWQKQSGRNNLPWQNTRDPYRVWLSEVMLQQTQVVTVKAYFARFTDRFPNVQALADANLDEVLSLWSGMGYYSRARNLHACARAVVQQHAGVFPKTAELLATLPGIGRSTAAAIASLCFDERVAILDGNVKRVLTRALGFSDDLAQLHNERQLWALAQALVPHAADMARYTQGMMDLGATVCLAKKPHCQQCPLANCCVAGLAGTPEQYPVKTRKLKRTAESLWMVWAQAEDGSILLQQRPTPGVWAGLYCFPLFGSAAAAETCVDGRFRGRLRHCTAFKHVLTHKDLHLHVITIQAPVRAFASAQGQWYLPEQWPALGMPAPVRKLLVKGDPPDGSGA